MAELEIIGPQDDPGVRICRMSCLEKNLPYRHREVARHSALAKRENQLGMLPALRHGKVRLFGARSITHYIDCHFNRRSLIPANIIRAAEVEQWIALVECSLNNRPHSQLCGDSEVHDDIHPCLHAVSDGIGTRMFLVGRGFTLADIWLMPTADALQRQIGSEKLLKDYPALGLWFQKHSSRKSWATLLQAEDLSR
jgi:glutathione S-transferase